MTAIGNKEADWDLLASALGTKVERSGMGKDMFISATEQSQPMVWRPTVLMEYGEPLTVQSTYTPKSFDSSDQSVNGWVSRIRDELYSIPSVEDIFVGIEDTDVDVWVVIPNRDINVLRQVIEREGELLKTFVSGENPAFLMDFHIIYRCGRDIEELAPTRAIRIPREV